MGDPCETLARNGFHPATPLYAASKLVSSLTSSMQHNHHRIIPVIFRKLSHSLFCFSSQNYGKKLNYIAHSFYYTALSHHSHSFDIMDIPFFLFFFLSLFFFRKMEVGSEHITRYLGNGFNSRLLHCYYYCYFL